MINYNELTNQLLKDIQSILTKYNKDSNILYLIKSTCFEFYHRQLDDTSNNTRFLDNAYSIEMYDTKLLKSYPVVIFPNTNTFKYGFNQIFMSDNPSLLNHEISLDLMNTFDEFLSNPNYQPYLKLYQLNLSPTNTKLFLAKSTLSLSEYDEHFKAEKIDLTKYPYFNFTTNPNLDDTNYSTYLSYNDIQEFLSISSQDELDYTRYFYDDNGWVDEDNTLDVFTQTFIYRFLNNNPLEEYTDFADPDSLNIIQPLENYLQ